MTIRDRAVGDVTIIDLEGRVTLEDGADAFRETAQQLIRQGRLKLVLNLQKVPYIDSTTLGEIIRAYTTSTRKGGSLKLLNVTPHVHELLVITRLLSVFDLFDAEGEAVRSFGTPRVVPSP
jgi:anti-sigma B factor antagonist